MTTTNQTAPDTQGAARPRTQLPISGDRPMIAKDHVANAIRATNRALEAVGDSKCRIALMCAHTALGYAYQEAPRNKAPQETNR